jgi:probable F420-dependent oxidoreductase
MGLRMPQVFVPAGAWNVRAGVAPAAVLAAARAAEAAGIDGVFAGDHVTFFGLGNDGLINLAPIAAVTERLLLRTSVYLLPLRHPVQVALQCAMLDQLSGGRFTLGIGVGGEDPAEFRACGVDPATRGARTNEMLRIMRRLWTRESTTFHGKHFNLENVGLEPKPLRPEGVPVFVGGRSEAALRRAARYGEGWTAIWVSARRFKEALARLDELAAEAGRDARAIETGLQVWIGVHAEADVARAIVGARMEAFYNRPFDSFERYVAYGPPEAVAEFLAPYIEAGCRHVHLVPGDSSPAEALESALAVRYALRNICD